MSRFQVMLEVEPGRAYAGSREACEAFAAAARGQSVRVTAHGGKVFELGEVTGARIEPIS